MKKAVKNSANFNYCYGCGTDNAEGMHLKFSIFPEEHMARGTFSVHRKYQGSKLRLHGGIIALLLDEAMGKLNKIDEIVAPTAELSVEYLRPIPVGRKIVVEARSVVKRGRNYWRSCTIHDPQGTLLVRGKARFVKVADRVAPAGR
jgi:uncharacterized protein (TIGR00369 family)